MKYLDNHCEPSKCCICAKEVMCLSLGGDSFILARRGVIADRLLFDRRSYQTYEIALMRKTLDDMAMEERETKEKEEMVSIKTVDVEKEKEAAREEGYKAGLEEAWEIARRIELCLQTCGYTHSQLMAIFNSPSPNEILKKLSIHEVKEKIAAYEAEQAKPKLGDVVKIDDRGEFLFLGEGREYYYALDPSDNDGIPHQFVKKYVEKIEKTGKHFDIQSMLDKIGLKE